VLNTSHDDKAVLIRRTAEGLLALANWLDIYSDLKNHTFPAVFTNTSTIHYRNKVLV
jgi:hypothetical protein